MDQLVSKRAYAKLRDWPPSYVMRLGQKGRLVMSGELVDVQATDKLLAETADPAWALSEENDQAASDKSPTFIQAKTKREWHEAQMAEIKHKKLLGSLVDAEDMKRADFAIARRIRDALLALPDRLAPTIASNESDARRVHGLLSAEIEQVLHGLSREFSDGGEAAASPRPEA